MQEKSLYYMIHVHTMYTALVLHTYIWTISLMYFDEIATEFTEIWAKYEWDFDKIVCWYSDELQWNFSKMTTFSAGILMEFKRNFTGISMYFSDNYQKYWRQLWQHFPLFFRWNCSEISIQVKFHQNFSSIFNGEILKFFTRVEISQREQLVQATT